MLYEYPDFHNNVFILTIDDLTLTEPYEYGITDDIVDFLDKYEIPATFFAIPVNMDAYAFSENYEVAQHGLTHFNKLTNSTDEFTGLSAEEISEKLRKGKELLEDLNYTVYGHRAPGWSLKEEHIPLLKKLYEYDSSFVEVGDDFIIEPIQIDIYEYEFCKEKCYKSRLETRKQLILNFIDRKAAAGEVIVILAHFWGFEKAFMHEDAIAYHEEFFDIINSRDYWKTTMKDYVIWRNNLKGLTYELEEDGSINITFNKQIQGLSFKINSKKPISSNVPLNCQMKNDYQLCVVEE